MKAISTFAGAFLFVLTLTGCDSPGVAPDQSSALSAPSQPHLSVKKDRPEKEGLVSLRGGLSKQARQMVTSSEEMDVEALLNLLSEELRFDGLSRTVKVR